MNPKLKTALWILGSGFAAFGIYRYFKWQVGLLKDYTYQFTGLKIITLTKNLVTIDVKMRFFTKSKIEVKVNRIYVDVKMNDKSVGFLNETQPLIIPANGYSDITLRMSFNPTQIVSNFYDLISNSFGTGDIKINFEGYANVKSGIISTTVPIAYETTLKEYLKG
jgi:LEA14-like dessication related protein